MRTLLAKYGLRADHVLRAAASLSPGERTRAALALLQARGVNLLVLDEPTNHLDLPAIEQLEQALDSFPGTLLLVSHDRRLLEAVRVTRRLHVDGRHRHGGAGMTVDAPATPTCSRRAGPRCARSSVRDDADFREGQWEAVHALVAGPRAACSSSSAPAGASRPSTSSRRRCCAARGRRADADRLAAARAHARPDRRRRPGRRPRRRP